VMKRTIGTAVLGTLTTEGGLLFIGVLTGSLTARFLLPEGRGALAAVLFWPQLLAGLGLLSINEAATYYVGTEPEHRSIIKASALWLSLIFSGTMIVVGFLLVPFLLGPARADLVSLTQVYLILFTPFNFAALTLLAGDQGELRFVRYNVLRLVGPLFYLSGLIALWLMGRVNVASVVVLNAAATVIVALVRMMIQNDNIRLRPSLHEMAVLVRLAVRFHPATILLLLAAQADQFVVLTLWDNTQLGQYMVALSMATSGLALVTGAFQRTLFPHLSQIKGQEQQAELFARSVRYTTLLLILVSVPIAVLMPWLIRFLFGPAFESAVGPAWMLILAYFFIGLKSIIIQCLRGVGKAKAGSMAAAISLGLFMAVVWPLGKEIGLVGVAVALGLANASAVTYLVYYLGRIYRLSLVDLWGLTPTAIGEFRASLARVNPFATKATV
jgi:O-antigen/teichoic acid export membrane protein